MAFSMRINFVDVICDDSLRNTYANGKVCGYEFDVRLSYYRGLFLSCVDSFELLVDGEAVPNGLVTFEINNKELFAEHLSDYSSEFWELLEPAKIRVLQVGGLAAGEHEIKLNLFLRVPYLPIPGSDGTETFVPLDSCGEKKFVLTEGGVAHGKH